MFYDEFGFARLVFMSLFYLASLVTAACLKTTTLEVTSDDNSIGMAAGQFHVGQSFIDNTKVCTSQTLRLDYKLKVLDADGRQTNCAQPVDLSERDSGTSLPFWLWPTAGGIGGLLFGSVISGAVGGATLASIGALGGMIRAETGKTMHEHVQEMLIQNLTQNRVRELILHGHAQTTLEDLPHNLTQRLVRALITHIGQQHVENSSVPGLSTDALARMDAGHGEPACKVCLDNEVTVVLHPCGHACLCGHCAAQLLTSAAGNPRCPVCRAAVAKCLRIYLH